MVMGGVTIAAAKECKYRKNTQGERLLVELHQKQGKPP